MTDPPVVLVVDDRPENLITVEAVLQPLGLRIQKALRAEDALHFLLDNDAAVILLDVEMPGIDGFETARIIRDRPRSHDTPIIFITAGDRGKAGVLEGYELGAVDYLVKPFQPEVLRWKVSVFAELYKSHHRERLFIREQTLRAEAEANARRAKLLGDVGRVLASNIRQGPLLDRLVHSFVPGFADCAAIYSLQSREAVQLDAVAGCGEADPELSKKMTVAYKTDDPLFVAAHDASPALIEDLAHSSYAELSPSHREFVQRHNFRSALFIPVQGREGIKAVLALYRLGRQALGLPDRAFANDLSARIALGVTNLELYQESERANRAKDDFLAVVSHELRTPLVSILGWANILLTQQLSAERTENALQTIQRNAKIQTNLINDILDFSKFEAGKLSMTFDAVGVPDIVKETIDSFRPLADTKKIQLLTQIDEEQVFVTGDRNRLHQLFSNIVSNAIKFTPEGGSVLATVKSTGQFVEIQIKDTGIGIEPEFLPRVFEPFAQADSSTTRSYPGLGLGLAIVRHLVDLHHGKIRVESAGRGKGATFTITLPSAAAQTRAC